ncbi:WW domain-containing oxidoreductase [Colletotrichum siamense]|nr:WW domain-containing oxidoreductase [Colletotrichum siamense]
MADRYVAVHANPSGPGDNRPDVDQIIRNEGLIDKLFNRTAFVTGCSAGIGIDIAKALFLTGASLYLTARNISKAKAALGDTLVSSPRVHLLELDLASFASVRKCAEAFLSLKVPLNILICNAGVMDPSGRPNAGWL